MYAWKITSALINYVKEKLPSWEIPQRDNFFYAQPILIRNCRQKCGESNLIQLQRVTLLVYVLQYLSHCTARLQLRAVSPNHELTFPFKSIKIRMHVPHLKQGTYTARTVCPHESWWRGVSTANQKIEQLKPRYDRQTMKQTEIANDNGREEVLNFYIAWHKKEEITIWINIYLQITKRKKSRRTE